MDEENTSAGTTGTVATTPTSGAIVDKTLGEIADGTVKDIKDNVETTVKSDVAQVEVKAKHEAHGILDELEMHLSQFDAHAVAIYHSFLQRLRNAI